MTSTSSQKQPISFYTKLTLLGASSLVMLAGAAVAPALPGIRDAFSELKNADVLAKLVLSLPALAIAVTAPLAGYLLDRFGRKRPMVVALFLYALAGSSGLYLQTMGSILLGRIFLGLAVAALMTSTTAMVADTFQGAERHRFMGLQAACMGYGGVIMLITAGVLADISWRLPFGVYLLAVLILPLAIFTLHDRASHTPNNTASVSKDIAPVPLSLLILIYATAFWGMVVFYMVPTQLPFLLSGFPGVNKSMIGFAIAWNSLLPATVALFYGAFRSWFSHPVLVLVMLLALGIGYTLVGQCQGYPQILASLAICCLGFGTLMPNLNVWLAQLIPPQRLGRFLGGMTAAVFLGQFFSPLIIEPLVMRWGISAAFTIVGGCNLVLLIGGAIYLGLNSKRTKRK